MGTFSIYGFLLLLLHFCSSEADVATVDVHVVRNLLSSGHHFLDVRTEEEFKTGHVENALNIPYMYNTPDGWVKNPGFIEQVLASYGKEDRIVVGCKSASGLQMQHLNCSMPDSSMPTAWAEDTRLGLRMDYQFKPRIRRNFDVYPSGMWLVS